VYLSIRDETDGVVEVSETVKKILLNYLQVVSIAALYPMRWPEAVQSFFEAQAAISSASEALLSPACELSNLRPAQAFYQIQVGFSVLPLFVAVLCALFWGIKGRCRWTANICDRLVLSVVVLMYLTYPTMVKQSLAALACENIGQKLWLATDLQEPCYEGAHLTVVLLLSLPQIILYLLGLPMGATALLFRKRTRLHEPRTQFRWGLLYAGYRPKVWWWELSVVVRKVSMILVGGVFGFHLKPDMQVHLALFLISLNLVAHMVAMPFDELTRTHRILHWLELGSLCVCWATLHSGTIFFIGENEGRISHDSLTALSFYVVGATIFTSTGVGVRIAERSTRKIITKHNAWLS
jgi:hypothetical protein